MFLRKMKRQIELQLRELLGRKEYNRLVEKVLVPEFEKLANSDRVEDRKLFDRLARFNEDYGAGIFDMWAADTGDTTKNTLGDGKTVIARKRLSPDREIKLFVKQFADRKSYDFGVGVQKKLADLVRGTDLEGSVPEQSYTNNRKRISVMPFVEGDLLSVAVTEENKKELFMRVIDEYVTLTEEAEKSRVLDPPERSFASQLFTKDLRLPVLENFDVFFEKFFGADERLARVYREEIASKLNGQTNEVLHGDLKEENIIVNGGVSFLDWEMSKYGFMEFDLQKWFAKSGITGNLEKNLVAYARLRKDRLRAEKRGYSVEWDNSAEERVNNSLTRYKLNQITQDLLTAERYAKRSEKEPNHKSQLEMTALTAYNLALRHIDAAEVGGLLSSEFKNALDVYVAKNKPLFVRVTDDEFDDLIDQCNPYTTTSKENMVSVDYGALPVMLDRVSQKQRTKQLRKIRRSLRKKNWFAIGGIATGLLALFSAGGVAGYNHVERVKAVQRINDERNEWLYSSTFSTGFNYLTAAKLDGGLTENGYIADRSNEEKIIFEGLHLNNDRNVIERISYLLVSAMYKTNACFAGIELSKEGENGINLLDPVNYWNAGRTPKANLESGVKRLARLFEKYGVTRTDQNEVGYSEDRVDFPRSLVRALAEFYSDEAASMTRYDGQGFDFSDNKPCIWDKHVVYTVLMGGPARYDFMIRPGGFPSLNYPPKEFTLK